MQSNQTGSYQQVYPIITGSAKNKQNFYTVRFLLTIFLGALGLPPHAIRPPHTHHNNDCTRLARAQ